MTPTELAEQVEAAGALDDPVRRALYLYVAGQVEAVSRERAAAATGISRVLAAFHLDRLVRVGLLEASFRRLTGRRGPGAGRPAKLYRRAARQVAITLPERRYELAAELFARALEDPAGGRASGTLGRAARAYGRSVGEDARRRAGAKPGRRAVEHAAVEILAAYGFEPQREGDDLWLRNCPFETLAREHRGLVCGLNRDLLQGVLEGLKTAGVTVSLEPRPGRCCVMFHGLTTRPPATPPSGSHKRPAHIRRE
ncbi:MAG TPA: hypothetical protein VET65_12115 [Candidatus Limnocylindrales bacterium]|nr:hypothetical protein [Candidatus Limnocylindrales bacterium]